MRYLELIILGLTVFIVRSGALKCYTCSYQFSGTSRDKECVDRPWNVTQGQKEIDCPYPYCVVFRQALKATNTIHSFHRGCEMQGRGNNCVHDSYYSTCSYTCDTDLCNSADGVPVGSEVGQDVIHNPQHQPSYPRHHRPSRPSRPTTRPARTRYNQNPNYGHNANYNSNANYDSNANYNNPNAKYNQGSKYNSNAYNQGSRSDMDGPRLQNNNQKVNVGDEKEAVDMPKKGDPERKEKGKDRGERGKNERRKGDCMHPYACDQRKFWPRNSGATLDSQITLCVQSCLISFLLFYYK